MIKTNDDNDSKIIPLMMCLEKTTNLVPIFFSSADPQYFEEEKISSYRRQEYLCISVLQI